MPSIRRSVAASAALALGLGGALLVAAPASAVEDDIYTPDWYWTEVSDNGLTVSDSGAFFQDFFGLGIAMDGWTSDAFDGFLNDISLDYDGSSQDVELTPVSSEWVDNGLSSLVAEGSVDFGDGLIVDVTSTLEIEGSFARWSFTFDDGDNDFLDAVDVMVTGNLGSDDDTVATAVGSDGFITHDVFGTPPTVYGYDPVIGYDVASGGNWDYQVQEDLVGIRFEATDTVLTVALHEYDPCSYQAAIDGMTSLIPTLAAQFGDTLAPYYTANCLAPSALAVQAGAPANGTLTLTPAPALVEWYGGDFTDEDFEFFTVRSLAGVPAGLTILPVYDPITQTVSLSVTGTPTVAGEFQVQLLGYFAYPEGDGEPEFNELPLFMNTTITVNGLAATGVDVTPSVTIGLLLLVAGIGAVVVTRRVRRQA